jgi:hypothetical protein
MHLCVLSGLSTSERFSTRTTDMSFCTIGSNLGVRSWMKSVPLSNQLNHDPNRQYDQDQSINKHHSILDIHLSAHAQKKKKMEVKWIICLVCFVILAVILSLYFKSRKTNSVTIWSELGDHQQSEWSDYDDYSSDIQWMTTIEPTPIIPVIRYPLPSTRTNVIQMIRVSWIIPSPFFLRLGSVSMGTTHTKNHTLLWISNGKRRWNATNIILQPWDDMTAWIWRIDSGTCRIMVRNHSRQYVLTAPFEWFSTCFLSDTLERVLTKNDEDNECLLQSLILVRGQPKTIDSVCFNDQW